MSLKVFSQHLLLPGSLIYAADMLPEYVILKPLAFLTTLAKLFRLTGNTEV